MRKRTDRAAAVKHVDRERLLGAKERLILGCDAAKEVWYGAWMNDQSEVLQTIRWDLVEDTTAVVALVEQLIQRQRPLVQPLGQRLPVEILHDQEVDPVLVPDVIEGADVRMVQAGDRLGFTLKPLLQIRIQRPHARAAL